MFRTFVRRFLRICVVLFVVAGVLFAAAIYGANQIANRAVEAYRGDIEESLSSALGSPVTIGGLSARLSPFPELVTTNLQLRSSSTDSLIEISEGRFRLSLIALLSRRLAIERAALRMPSFSIPTKHGALNLENINLIAKFEVEESQTNMHDLKITGNIGKLPLELTGSETHFDRKNETLKLSKTSLSLGESRLDLNGSIDLKNESIDLHLTNLLLESSVIELLLRSISGSTKSTTSIASVSGSLLAAGTLANDLTLRGALKVREVKSGTLQLLRSASLQNLELRLNDGQLVAGRSDLSVEALHIIDSTDRYKAKTIDGYLALVEPNKSQKSRIKGKLNVVDFEFADGTTTLEDVSFGLDSLDVSEDKKGSITASTTVLGSKLRLTNESVKVDQIQSLSAPLTVTVPKSGGYKVSGPVAVKGAVITTLDNDLKNTTGTVDILVSPKVKRFSTKQLAFTRESLQARVKATFEMFPERYTLSNFDTDLLAGNVTLSGTMKRRQDKQFSANVTATGVDLLRVSALVDPTATEPMVGKVDNLKLNMTGTAAAFPESIVGTGELNISQPEAKRSKLARLITGALSTIPSLGSLFGSSPARGTQDRQTITAKFQLKDSKCNFEQVTMERSNYTVQARGTAGFDKKLKIDADVILLQESAASLGLDIGPLRRLFGRAAKIVIPLVIRGDVSDPKVEVDLVKFLKNSSGLGLGEDLIRGMGNMLLPKRE